MQVLTLVAGETKLILCILGAATLLLCIAAVCCRARSRVRVPRAAGEGQHDGHIVAPPLGVLLWGDAPPTPTPTPVARPCAKFTRTAIAPHHAAQVALSLDTKSSQSA